MNVQREVRVLITFPMQERIWIKRKAWGKTLSVHTMSWSSGYRPNEVSISGVDDDEGLYWTNHWAHINRLPPYMRDAVKELLQ